MTANLIGPAPPIIVIETGPAGPPGSTGAAGPAGPAGPPGSVPTTYQQAVAESVWQFEHSYPYRPDVDTYDTSGNEIIGDVSHPTPHTVRVTFGFDMAGSLEMH